MGDIIPLSEIPQSFLDTVRDGLKHFLVAMLGQSETPSGPTLTPIGSGTLIQVGPTPGILTAAHVWHAARRFKRVHIVLTDRVATAFWVSPDDLKPQLIWGGKKNEWGPDLAFLELSPDHHSVMSASKSFLNLTKQKAEFANNPPVTEKRLWVTTGLVAEFSTTEHIPEEKVVSGNADCQALFSSILNTEERKEHDYFDVGANQELEGVPKSFGWVIGGGLWQIDVSRNTDGEYYWNNKLYLRGIAFWETAPVNGRQVVRHHGPKSLYETAWKEWEFPV